MRRTTLFIFILAAVVLGVPQLPRLFNKDVKPQTAALSAGKPGAVQAPQAAQRHHVQTFLVYSVGLAGIILSLLTILAGCKIICEEQARRYVFTPLTKPVPRWQYVIGRWAGLVLFQMLMIAAVGLAVYGTAQVLRLNVKDRAERLQLDNQVFAGRYRSAPNSLDEDLPKVAAKIMQQREQNERLKDLSPEQIAASWDNARLLAREALENVAPFGRLGWRFTELPKPLNDNALVEFHFTAGTGKAAAGTGLKGIFLFSRDPNSEDAGAYFRSDATFLTDRDSSILLPAHMVGSDGRLFVEFLNENPGDPAATFDTTLMFPPEELYIIYPVAPIEPNFLRLLLMMLILQVFLASTTLLAGTWLSFPVATLMCLTIYAIGAMQRFLVEATAIRYKSGFWVYLGHYIYGGLQHIMPNFELIDTSTVLMDSLVVPWTRLAVAGVAFVGVWTVLALTVAAFVFTKRELASVIVE
jgi:ABC-type transport system involved in multi-copper enzyme maturation permease subunit